MPDFCKILPTLTSSFSELRWSWKKKLGTVKIYCSRYVDSRGLLFSSSPATRSYVPMKLVEFGQKPYPHPHLCIWQYFYSKCIREIIENIRIFYFQELYLPEKSKFSLRIFFRVSGILVAFQNAPKHCRGPSERETAQLLVYWPPPHWYPQTTIFK